MKLIPLLPTLDFIYGPFEYIFWMVFAPTAAIVTGAYISHWYGRYSGIWDFDDACKLVGGIVIFNSVLTCLIFVVVNIFAYSQSQPEMTTSSAKYQSESGLESRENQKKASEKAVYDEKLSEFKSKEGVKIQAAIADLTILENSLSERIHALESFIKHTGKDPSNDEDLLKWKENWLSVKKNLTGLNKSLLDAFIQYQKFKLTATTKERTAFERAIETGSADAQEIVGRYSDLMQQLSGTPEKPNGND